MNKLIIILAILCPMLAIAKADERLSQRAKIQEKIGQINNTATHILSLSQYSSTTDKELCYMVGEMMTYTGGISNHFGPAKLTKTEETQLVKVLTTIEDMKRFCLNWPREESQGDIVDVGIGLDAFNLVLFTKELKL